MASLTTSCGASFPRETRASNARSDDGWLQGDHCATDAHDSAKLRVEDTEAGSGRPVESGDTVRVHYVAGLPDGATLHNTRSGGPPIEMIIGSAKTICGFDEALVGMRAGGQRRVFVPWQLAFGEKGRAPDVPQRADLVFVIDLYLPADSAYQRGSPPLNPTMGPRPR
jgi:FKBP-type peptidyl-prolyl cis-trans isomerase